MVNKPAALYLEDARKAREYIFHDLTPSLTATSLTSPCTPTPVQPMQGTLRPITLVSASPFAQSQGSAEQSLLQLANGQSTAHGARGLQTSRSRRARPEIMYGRLDTGYFFECHASYQEHGSYISLELFRQILPRPDFTPASQNHTLRYNNDTYPVLGFVQFNLAIKDPLDSAREVQLRVSASVVPNIYPDLFLGRLSQAT